MSNSVQPHRWQPMRLPCPWDSPGKNTGVGCHFLLQCMKVKMKVKSLSCVRFLATPWTAAYHASLSMGFSRQEYWSGVPLPSPIRANLSFSGRLHKMYIGFWIKVTTSIYKSKIITRKMGTGKFYVYLPIFFFQYICLSWETCPENYLMNRMS